MEKMIGNSIRPFAGVLCQCNATAALPGALRNGRCGKSCPRQAQQVKRAGPRSRSGDVGNRMIGQRRAGVPGPARRIERRTSLRGLKGPQPQVLEDAPDDSRILDLSAMTRIGPLPGREDRAPPRLWGHSKGSASYTLRISRARWLWRGQQTPSLALRSGCT
jgi:hypothetical protein